MREAATVVRDRVSISLKNTGAILLVSCYEMGHQPLSIASPAAFLRKAGFNPTAVDLAIERLDPGALARARFVAIAVPMHTALRVGSRAVERIRSLRPDAHICLYGLYASLNSATLLKRGADSIIGGEYEEPLLRLVEHLERGDDRPVAGVRTTGSAAEPWLEKIPFEIPWRGLLQPLDRYVRIESDGVSRPAGHVETSRGCLHHCRHCPIPPVYGGRFFVVPRDVVLADVRNQVAAGATHITFGDPDFLNGPGHAMAILRAMHREFPGLTFDFTAKIEHLLKHRALLSETARLGCLFVVSAVESLNDRVLAILDKGHTRADVEATLGLLRRAGIAMRPSFVPFTPWTGRDDYLQLLDFIGREELVDHVDPVQLSIRLLLPPGSLLVGRPEVRAFLGPLDPDRYTYLWTHPDPAMDRLQREVGTIVERSVREETDAHYTFLKIRAAARSVGEGRDLTLARSLSRPPARRDKGRPPRLTEPWFC